MIYIEKKIGLLMEQQKNAIEIFFGVFSKWGGGGGGGAISAPFPMEFR